MNRYMLSEKDYNKFIGKIQGFINKVEKTKEDYESLDLTDLGITPYNLQNILERLGYEHLETSTNGWEMDFQIFFKKENFKSLAIEGCAMTFELSLSWESDE